MGLIKAAIAAGSSTLADQWLEYIYCERMEDNVLMRKGQPKSEGSNTKGTDNIIVPILTVLREKEFLKKKDQTQKEQIILLLMVVK